MKIDTKNKALLPHSPRQTSTLTGCDLINMDTAQRHERKRSSANRYL